MTLFARRRALTGSYFYPKVGKNIALSGTIDKDGNVSISESDDSGKQTGVFKGKWKPATDSPDPTLNEIDGSGRGPMARKKLRFWCRSSRWNSPRHAIRSESDQGGE